jgi:peptidoglycan/xylan/chitin deacetylase (PgdA/CDA1 family)
MNITRRAAILASAAFCSASLAAGAQVIILKFDDVTAITPRWQRVADYIEKKNLKASFGIIGDSLESDNATYFDWIKSLSKRGAIEFWNHGYRNRKADDKFGEFEQGTVEEQQAALEKTQRLAKQKLGFELKAFGPHWSATTAATSKALEAIPELKILFAVPSADPKKFVLERVLTLENPTFVTDAARFKETYGRSAATKPYLSLQGHPNQWDDQRWAGFVEIIDFLKSKNCIFMTPSEYIQGLSKNR